MHGLEFLDKVAMLGDDLRNKWQLRGGCENFIDRLLKMRRDNRPEQPDSLSRALIEAEQPHARFVA
jgi:hypothetical protein